MPPKTLRLIGDMFDNFSAIPICLGSSRNMRSKKKMK